MSKRVCSLLLSFVMVFTAIGIAPTVVFAEPNMGIDSFSFEGYTIPAYDGDAYEIVNGNDPAFEATEFVNESYENYSELDELGRCGVAQACLAQDRMPSDNEERGDISNVFPTGWIQASYSIVPNSWLYNRCHLIGWQLSAENANAKNIITGTRSFNIDGMLPFENDVAEYIEDTNNHVLYRVTPVFQGNNLLATGVLIEAESVENDDIEFCVFCYNVQDGISLDYSDGSSCLADSVQAEKSIKECIVSLSATKYTYTGAECNPTVTIIDDDKMLVEDEDYVLSYYDNTNAGTATVIIEGIGSYYGEISESFSIVKKSVSGLTFSSIANKTYTGSQIKPSITVKHGSKLLTKEKDYKVSYSDNTKVGTAKIVITGIGNYAGTVTKKFTIVKKSVSGLSYSTIANKVYSGKKIKPSIKVKHNSKILTKDKDYTVSYGTNKKIGKGYLVVKGKGQYTGSKKVYFYIVPKTPSLKVKSTTKSSIAVKWSSVAGKSGYQVAYKKSGTSKYKTAYTTNTSKTFSKLSAGTKYNFKVRSYKTIDGAKRFGNWSSVKTYKTKTTKVASTIASSKTVYITATGKKYHLSKSCRGLSNANKISTTTLSKAKAQGLTLCGYED